MMPTDQAIPVMYYQASAKWRIHIYTDGSSRGNPGPGGYGIVMELVGMAYRKEFSEGFRRTTNNRMELLAVIVALEKIKSIGQNIIVFTDSKYVAEAVQKQWVFHWEKNDFQMKKNSDLWQRFLKIYRWHWVTFQWIKGHSNHPQNERCHRLAVQTSLQKRMNIDQVYEQQNPFRKRFLL
ncbi:MAG: ribonuclease HI [Flavobacteriales bacterium AspAUS03]